MPKLTQDFNISPYYDDFNEANKFYKVLYRPGYSVQARELNQIQSILQNQLEKTGDTLYQDGSKVLGAELILNNKINSLKLKPTYSDVAITATSFNGRIIQGQTSGAKAEVVTSQIFTTENLDILMINYVDDTKFLDNETINTIDTGTTYFATVAGADEGLTGATTSTSLASGLGSIVSVNEGLFYIGGYFVYVSPQNLILDTENNNPSTRIGLTTTESIVSSIEDSTLLDNALGTPNYSAPGANRYKLELILSLKSYFESGKTVASSGVTFSVNTKDNRSGTVSVTTTTDHNLSVGDVIVVSGITEADYNGKYSVSAVGSTTTFSYLIQGKPSTPATGTPVYVTGVVDPIARTSDSDFIELLRLENGEKIEEVKFPIMGNIEKTLARRTFDASGDFTVRPFSLDVMNHKIQGTAGERTTTNTSTTITANGANFIADVNVGDTIFFSGNTSKTGEVSSITNGTTLTLTTGTALGDGSNNQKIGVSTKLSAELSPGKAYIKGFEHETMTPTYVNLNKARSTESVSAEKQGVEFGPYAKVSDVISNTAFSLGVNSATINSTSGGTGADLLDLHMVKWPSTTQLHGTVTASEKIIWNSNGAIGKVGIDNTSAATIANTKIGTVRLRQLDFREGRSSTVTDEYGGGADANGTYHIKFPAIYDAHLFDFRFDKTTGTVAGAVAANDTIISLPTSGANSFPTVNCLYGATITVNTSYLGVNTSDTRDIIAWTGANSQAAMGFDLNADGSAQAAAYHAQLDSSLTQATQSTSTYTLTFGIKDIRSAVQTTTTTFDKAMNIDISGKNDLTESGNTVIFDNNDDQRSLLFPYQNKTVAGLTKASYKLKRSFTAALTGNSVAITATEGGELFYPATGAGNVSAAVADANYLVFVPGDGGGEYIEFSNTSGSSLGDGRYISLNATGDQLTINVESDTSGARDYTGNTIHVVATMMYKAAGATRTNGGIGTKTLVVGNTTVANVTSGSSNTIQADSGQIYFGKTINAEPKVANSLKVADVKKLVAVVTSLDVTSEVTTAMMTAALADTANAHNITSNFIFDNGQKDNYYDYGTITLKPGEDRPTGQVIAIVDYYNHTGYGPFTVDSYVWSGSGNTAYADIPSFTSPITGAKVELRDMIDFRPKRLGYETSDGTNSQTNDITATANVFNEKAMPDYDYTFDTDYSYYISRKDKIVLNRDRTFDIIEGVSDKFPQLPADDDDSMTLYNLEIPAYTFNADDVKVNYVDNKRFTMRDVGKLERRIENLEYYVSLSLLEKEADGLIITDANGSDRFKNGILVDPFAGHNIGDVFNDDFNASIDYDKKILRPSFSTDLHPLNFNANSDSGQAFSTLVNNSGVLTLPFAANSFISMPLTGSNDSKNTQKTFQINPFSVQNYMGQMKLDPYGDMWYDQSNQVQVKVNIEGQYDNWVSGILTNKGHGTHWNDWEEIWSGSQINNDVKEGVRDTGDISNNNRKAKTTEQNKTLTGLSSGSVPEKIIKTVGNKTVNLSVVPKVRQQSITFIAKGLKPNKNVYAYFGDLNVTSNVKQACVATLSNVSTSNVFRTTSGNFEQTTIQGSGSNASNTAKIIYMSDRNSQNSCTVLLTDLSAQTAFSIGSVIQGDFTKANGAISAITHYGIEDTLLTVSSEGVVGGVFNVPADTFTGNQNLFRLTDEPDNISSVTTSVAEEIFHSTGVLDTKTELGLVSIRPFISRRENIKEERVTRSTSDGRQSKSTDFMNPMAQTFSIDKNQYPAGIFVDSLTLFFNGKDVSVGNRTPVTLQLRPLVNGIPSTSLIIPGSEVVLTPGRITANTSTPIANTSGGFPAGFLGNSDTANKSATDVGSRTMFKFDHPIFLSPDEYAICVLTNSSSYKLYGFEYGAYHTGTSRKITKQPYVGSFFKPSNVGNWQEVLDQGLMFQLNRCEFISSNAYARLDNSDISSGNASSNTTMDAFKVVTDSFNFANTYTSFDYYTTDLAGATKGSNVRFKENKNIDFKKQKQITYPQVANNSFTINAYFETANSLITPVIDEQRTGIISIENLINNGSLSNSDIVLSNTGTGYYLAEVGSATSNAASDGNTSVFVVSAPDIGANTATLAANVHANGIINQVVVKSGGSGYISTPSITNWDTGGSVSSADNVRMTTAASISVVGEGANNTANIQTTNVVSFSSGGNLTARYISRRVTLEEGFDAMDIKLYMDAYKPRGANIHAYYKVLSGEDAEPFDEKPWVLMYQKTADTTYSINENDFKRFQFNTFDEKITYISGGGGTFERFRTFAIKLVMTLDRVSQDSFIGIPKIANLRAIALDSEGTP